MGNHERGLEGRALRGRQRVEEAIADTHGWAYSTVKTTMDRMVAKRLLATHSIRNLQLFTAAVSRNEAQRFELRQLLRRAFDRGADADDPVPDRRGKPVD